MVNATQLPIHLICTNISYQTDTIKVIADQVTIKLKPSIKILNELTVSNLGFKLLNKTLERAYKSPNLEQYANAFYRQQTFTNNQITEFKEVFYKIKENNLKIEGKKISNARYAAIKGTENDKVFRFSNFTYIIFNQSISRNNFVPNSNRTLRPLCPNYENFYNVTVDEILQNGKQKIAVLNCNPSNEYSKEARFVGKLYVDMDRYELLSVRGKYLNLIGSDSDTQFLE